MRKPKKEAIMSEQKSVVLLTAAYMAVMVMSFIYNFQFRGISYQDSGFVVAELPFLVVLVVMTGWYVWKYGHRFPLPVEVPPQSRYFVMGGVPLVVTVLLVFLSQFQPNFAFLLPLIGTLLVGFGEEFLFRRILLPYFLKKFPIRKAIILSALAFGVFHAINSFAGSDVKAVIVQVVTTTILGFYYAYLYLFTRNIAWCAVDHGLWDYIVFNQAAASSLFVMGLLLVQVLLRIVVTILMARQVAKIAKS